ncbi:hypothetical protein FQN50_002972 [Emmonsiellopsis sp. PD_5]|nr:hypothetical protein FQN50_002972 [Emmonsiellopsis sp. PD_5]
MPAGSAYYYYPPQSKRHGVKKADWPPERLARLFNLRVKHNTLRWDEFQETFYPAFRGEIRHPFYAARDLAEENELPGACFHKLPRSMKPRPGGFWERPASDGRPDYHPEESDPRGSSDNYDRSKSRGSDGGVPYRSKKESHERPMNITTNSPSTFPNRRKRARMGSPNAPERHDGNRPPKLRRTGPSSPSDTLFANAEKVRAREKELVRENRELKGRLAALHVEIGKLRRRRSPAAPAGPRSSATAVDVGGLAGEVHRSFDTLWGSVVRYVAPVYLGDSGLQVGCDAIKEKIGRIEALGASGMRKLGDGNGQGNGRRVEVLV